eukprot:1418756-Rhodomonas_salina.2
MSVPFHGMSVLFHGMSVAFHGTSVSVQCQPPPPKTNEEENTRSVPKGGGLSYLGLPCTGGEVSYLDAQPGTTPPLSVPRA